MEVNHYFHLSSVHLVWMELTLLLFVYCDGLIIPDAEI